jgi:hypothetical protein
MLLSASTFSFFSSIGRGRNLSKQPKLQDKTSDHSYSETNLDFSSDPMYIIIKATYVLILVPYVLYKISMFAI